MREEKESFWKSPGWREWVVIASVPTVAAGVAAILSEEFRSFVSNSATAAWVQAIGSVIAIAVALLLSKRQSGLSRALQEREWDRQWEERTRERIDTIQAIGRAVEFAASATDFACNELIEHLNDLSGLPGEWNHPVKVSMFIFDRLSLHEHPGILVAGYVLNLRLSIERLDQVFVDMSGSLDLANTEMHLSKLREIKEDIQHNKQDLSKFVDAYDGSLAAANK